MDHGVAFGAFLRRRFTVALSRLLDLKVIDRPVPENVAAEIENQAVSLARMQAENREPGS